MKDNYPIVEVALKRADACIQEARFHRSKIIKIIHGYGSSGVGGDIKIALHQHLDRKQSSNQIKAYIPGEAFREILGFDKTISIYKQLINQDHDARIGNMGVTFIII